MIVTNASRITIIAAVVVAVAAPAAAQRPAADAATQELKDQVRTFETILSNAVLRAGQRLAKEAIVHVPQVNLDQEASPLIRGVILPTADGHADYIFDVEVPRIVEVQVKLFNIYQRRTPVQPAANPGRTAAAGVVTPDPMTADPAGPAFEPTPFYSNLVKSNVTDAMLDNSAGLHILEGDRLIVIVSDLDLGLGGQLYRADVEKLILSISGADLGAYHQQKISKDEAAQRIRMNRF